MGRGKGNQYVRGTKGVQRIRGPMEEPTLSLKQRDVGSRFPGSRLLLKTAVRELWISLQPARLEGKVP